MNKKLFFSLCLVLLFIFSFTYTFAANGLEDAAEGVRNVVGGAENVVEDAAKDVSNTSRDITGGVEDGAQDMTNDGRNTTGALRSDTNYDAQRTSTTTDGTLMGMNSTAWTWIIIALVWYYSMQLTGNNYNDKDE